MDNVIINDSVIMRTDQVVADYSPLKQNPFDLTGKHAIVTGAGRGMGREIAIGLARSGADVAIVDLNETDAACTIRLVEELGQKAVFKKTDVSDYHAVCDMVQSINSEFGGIDILVNNAGICTGGSFPEVEPEEWDHTMKVNLNSVFYCSKVVSVIMIKKGTGSIINIGSSFSSRAAALNFLGGSPEYCASKAAVQAFTRSSAQFLASKGIRVNAIAPGPVDSPMHAHRRAGLASDLPKIPLGRIQVSEDLVGPVIFLASDAARFITGQCLHVNGGLLMVD